MQHYQQNTQPKESPRFKLIVPENINKQFRYLIEKKFPAVEWSGTLFYDVEGDYNEIFTATVRGFYLEDIGTSGFTSYQEGPELVAYMLEKDLLDCQRGLIHSHHSLGAFFSGQDDTTLKKEAKNYNHFLSLIVDTQQNYKVKMSTLKVQEIEFSGSIVYHTFSGLEQKKVFENQKKTEETIEIITGEVEIESSPSEAFEELDQIIKELQSVKTIVTYPSYGRNTMSNFGHNMYDYDDGYYANYREFGQPIGKQAKLFNETGFTKDQIAKNKRGKKGQGFKKETTNHANTVIGKNAKALSFMDELAVKRYAKAMFHNALLEYIQTVDPVTAIQHSIIPIIDPAWKDDAFFKAQINIDNMTEVIEELLVQGTVKISNVFEEYLSNEKEELFEDLLLELMIPVTDFVVIDLVEKVIADEFLNIAKVIKHPFVSQTLTVTLQPVIEV